MLTVRQLVLSSLTMLRLCFQDLTSAGAMLLLLAVYYPGSVIAQTLITPPSTTGPTMPPNPNALPPPGDPEPQPVDNAQGVSISAPSTMAPGSTAYVTVTMYNSGNSIWDPAVSNPYRLGSWNPIDNQTWGIGRVDLTNPVPITGQAVFGFTITAPSTPGTYSFSWAMLREGLFWFGQSISSTITVSAASTVYDAQLVSASVPAQMTAGSNYNVSMTFKNSGNTTWTSPDFLLGNADNNYTFGLNRVSMSSSSVAPGQNITFSFQVQAPSTAGSYAFQWGMLWENHQRFGQTTNTTITVNPVVTAPKPTINVTETPAPTAGSVFSTIWSTGNATSLTRVCTASGTGFTVNESLPVTGSRTQTAQAAWVNYPSTCTWTASGAGGSTTYTELLQTGAAPSTPKPTVNVSRNAALVAGQTFTTTWSTTNTNSLSHVCTSTGTGYTVNEQLPLNSSRAQTALAGWVNNPSSCTWTASGNGGTTTYMETMTTTAASGGSGVTYIHTDGLGSPVARTDATGNVISRTRYEPYGYVASGVQPTIGFTGHSNDVDTGLTYMQQRYYDPVAGRFMSIDPVVTDTNNGGIFNRYSYAQNNPYRYIDPDGRQSQCAMRENGGQTCIIEANTNLAGAAAMTVGAGVWNAGVGIYEAVSNRTKSTSGSIASSKAKDKSDGYTVRVQAQGTSLKNEVHVPLIGTTPIKADAVQYALKVAEAQLTSKEQRRMGPAFEQASSWVESARAAGGVSMPGTSKSFNLRGVSGEEARVDIEVIRGSINIVP